LGEPANFVSGGANPLGSVGAGAQVAIFQGGAGGGVDNSVGGGRDKKGPGAGVVWMRRY
jgi:hypothetical protein